MVRTPGSHCRRPGFDPWPGKRSHRPQGAEKKKKKIRHRAVELLIQGHRDCSWLVNLDNLASESKLNYRGIFY